MKKVTFVKPAWLFQSGDQAHVPDRIANWLASHGTAYVSTKKSTPPPMQPERKKQLTTRKAAPPAKDPDGLNWPGGPIKS